MRSLLMVATLGSLGFLAACGGEPPADLVGEWRAVLESPGGELPFGLVVRESEGGLVAAARNGGEEVDLGRVELRGDRGMVRTDWYDSDIEFEIEADGGLRGRWRKTQAEGDSTLPFRAVRDDPRRFLPIEVAGGESATAPYRADVSGSWQVVFADDSGEEPALGELEQDGERVTGTFLTPTGDYRYLVGEYRGGRLRLSTFDGAHAFLFDARARSDGSLAGDFWSRDSYHATWTASLSTGDEAYLPDPFSQVGLTNSEGRLAFSFPDLDGVPVSLGDPRFQGKVVVVEIFGSWCPNCNDSAPVLAEWYGRYRDRGLEIVGLAYEMTGDPERDRKVVRLYGERHGISYPLLLAGRSDKEEAAETLPDLSAILAFPTAVFLDREGRVRRIHSGFAGPGTGGHHRRMVEGLETLIEELLAEPVTS